MLHPLPPHATKAKPVGECWAWLAHASMQHHTKVVGEHGVLPKEPAQACHQGEHQRSALRNF
eukprot:6116897-Amphidinium_carterae.1